jgi:cathepsin X
LSSLADRIKISRKAEGDDINLSIQFILNCGADVAGSCHGGYHTGVYEFIKQTGYVPFDTCMTYMACSQNSDEGFCGKVDTTCSAINTCRTCDTFAGMGGACTEVGNGQKVCLYSTSLFKFLCFLLASQIDSFPNATVAEYGQINDDPDAIMAEIYARGPVAAAINAEPIVKYRGGIFDSEDENTRTNHIVSIVGWGTNEEGKKYWIIRNSWVSIMCFTLIGVVVDTHAQVVGRILGRDGILSHCNGQELARH